MVAAKDFAVRSSLWHHQ